jgi:glutathione peroxidase
MSPIYEFSAQSIDGNHFSFSDLKGKVLLIVNTASACGFTPQFSGLESLYKALNTKGLEVIGFPCNQFGGQDPASNQEIATFCHKNYGVSFRMMEKIEVNGSNAHPLFKWLKEEAPGILGTEGIKWNFTKFLVGREGKVIHRYGPQDKPENMISDIEKALAT